VTTVDSSDRTAKEEDLESGVPAAGEPSPDTAVWFRDFREFVATRGPRLHAQARALTHDPQLAEDAVSETFWQVYRRWNRIARMSNPDGYVQKILTNQCRRLFRSSYTRLERPLEPADLRDRSGPVDPHAGHDEDQRVGAALRKLSPQQRTVLYYRYFKDYSDQTIAEIMGLNPDVVRNYASVGQRRLRLLLAEEAGEK
jgi:RNA polymerase sigma factor (sigma-70 family)